MLTQIYVYPYGVTRPKKELNCNNMEDDSIIVYRTGSMSYWQEDVI